MKFVEDFSEARLENSLDRKLDMATVMKQIFTEEITENNTTRWVISNYTLPISTRRKLVLPYRLLTDIWCHEKDIQ